MTNEKAPAGQGEGSDQNPSKGTIVNIIPETPEVRQSIHRWAEEYGRLRDLGGEDFRAPRWPVDASPWWVTESDVALESGGEVLVILAREVGEVSLMTGVTVVVDHRGPDAHDGATFGDYVTTDEGVSLTILGKREALTVTEAATLFDSLAQATALLVQIEGVAGLRSKIEAHFEAGEAE